LATLLAEFLCRRKRYKLGGVAAAAEDAVEEPVVQLCTLRCVASSPPAASSAFCSFC